MAITLIGTGTISATAALATSIGINMAGATLLVAHVNAFGYTPTPNRMTDSSGNTWQQLSEYTGNTHVFPNVFYCVNPTVTATQTFTYSGTLSDGKSLVIAGFSGVDTLAPLDFDTTTQGVSTASPSSGAVAPALNNCLILSGLVYQNSTATGTPAGFTQIANIPTSVAQGNGLAYLIQGTASSVTPTWGMTASTVQWAQLNVVFIPSQATGNLKASTYVASTNKNTCTSTSMDTTNANFIYLEVSDTGNGTNTTVVSDSVSNTYTAITTYTFGANRVSTWYSTSPIVSSTHTFTASNSNAGPVLCVAAFSGMSTTPFDTVVGNNLNVPGTLTPTNNNELLITALSLSTVTNTTSQYGWQLLGQSGSNTNCGGGAFAFKRAATKKATTITWSSDNAGRVSNMAAFIISNNSTVNQTISGQARIQLSSTQTTTGKSRIGTNVSKTILGKAHLTGTTLQTIFGKANIIASTAQTVLGKARLTNTTSQVITGKARIRQTVNQSLAGISRIIVATSKTITGKATLFGTIAKTLLGQATIGQTTRQTISGQTRIVATTTQTITGKARIFHQSTTDRGRIFLSLADTRNYSVVAEVAEFDTLTDERDYKVVK